MSEHSIAVVRLDSTAKDVEPLATRLTQWLLDRGVIQANKRPDSLWQPSEWMPGPRWHLIVEVEEHAGWEASIGAVRKRYTDVFETTANNGVDVVVERQIHHSIENFEPPICPQCETALDGRMCHEMIESWLMNGEPTVPCAKCGWTAPIGDWPAPWGFAVGAPAVVFNNWPQLSNGFLGNLRLQMGGRTFVVQSHW